MMESRFDNFEQRPQKIKNAFDIEHISSRKADSCSGG